MLVLTDAELAFIAKRVSARRARIEGEISSEVQSLSLQIAGLAEKLARLTDAVLDDLIDRVEYAERKTTLLNQRITLEEALARARLGITRKIANQDDVIELLKVLTIEGALEKPQLLLPTAKKILSKWDVYGKRLVPAWHWPFNFLFPATEIHSSGPYRGTSRTLDSATILSVLEKDISGNVPTSPHPPALTCADAKPTTKQLREADPTSSSATAPQSAFGRCY